MRPNLLKNSNTSTLVALLINFFTLFVLYFLFRVLFLLENNSYFAGLSFADIAKLFRGGVMFDISAICFMNALYIAMMLFPLRYKERRGYHLFLRIFYTVINGLAVIMSMGNTLYFKFTNRITDCTIFHEFGNESDSKLVSIVINEMFSHWYITLAAIVLIFLLYKLYVTPRHETNGRYYYLVNSLSFLVLGYLSVIGMRGGFGMSTRPIELSNANKFIEKPIEANIVLNTPFAIIKTIEKSPFQVPQYFEERETMTALYSPLQTPEEGREFKPYNVVVIIIESFGSEYSGWLNRDKEDYKGFTPFLDSLMQSALVIEHSYANGRKSIDAMPSVISGIPSLVTPFLITPYALNQVTGLAQELSSKGYHSSFFHGAQKGSMGFEAYAKSTGYTSFYDRSTYGNDKDYDGFWGIWDEEFLRYFAENLKSFKEPFNSAIFTISSHHPFNVPAKYKGKFPEGSNQMHKCIAYTDYSLRLFFKSIENEPWFDNTLFVITGDHTNLSSHPEYSTASGLFKVPVVFYRRGDSELKGVKSGIAQQIDIMPSILGYLGYDRPFISFGQNLFSSPAEKTFAINYLNGFHFFYGDYFIQFDGEKTTAAYNLSKDPLLERNISGEFPEQASMELLLKSIIQQYMERVVGDSLILRKNY